MKYLITDDRLEGTIERFIKTSFPEVITVSFKTKPVMLASRDNEIIQRKVIEITMDPHNILTGGESVKYDVVAKLKGSIKVGLDSMFGLGLQEYGSKWEVNTYVLKRVEV